MSREQILERLKQVIEENLEHPLPADAGEASRVYEDLNIDSIMVLQLVVYIEEAFEVSVPDENVDPSAFETLGGLVAFIQDLQASRV
ncbi:phosphopantetheine-binding protein [Cohnella cellulosilytica]|uniref:Phosphopantetheine-binding protein n=1 Tax=Cohnella cellulosilytica TaxID=986710 RepID=A0ABW2F869_9BACL